MFFCSRNFDPSRNMALENGGYLNYVDLKKFLKKSFLKLQAKFQLEALERLYRSTGLIFL